MALLKKPVAALAKPKAGPVKAAYSLPQEMNTPAEDLGQYSMLLYGRKKIGKTSLAAQFPGAFIICTEPGAKALRVFQDNVSSWDKAVACVEAVSKSEKFDTIVIDTVDLLYDLIFDLVCKRQMIEHPNDENDFGKTWKTIRREFRTLLTKLLDSGKGVILLSHETEKEVEDRNGDKFDRIQPTMAKQALEEVEGICDVIALYDYEDNQRVLRIKGDQFTVAGCRCEENFLRKGGVKDNAEDRVQVIPMGGSPAEGYRNFVKAFNNEQVLVGLPVPPPKVKTSLIKAPNKPKL